MITLLKQLRSSSRERKLAGENFVENDTQAVDVTALIDRMSRVAAAGLLRAHVCRGADNRSVESQINRLLVEESETEIDDPGFTGPTRSRIGMERSIRRKIGVEHDVGWFDVAMNGAHRVGVRKRVGDLRDQIGRLPSVEPPFTQEIAQRHACDEIADEYRQAIEIGDVPDSHDTRMSKLAGGPCLPVEPRDIFGGFDQVGVRNLESGDPVQSSVERAPDSPKSADADPLEKLEPAERPALVRLGG